MATVLSPRGMIACPHCGDEYRHGGEVRMFGERWCGECFPYWIADLAKRHPVPAPTKEKPDDE